MSINVLALLSAMLTIATPLVVAGIGELIVEKTGSTSAGGCVCRHICRHGLMARHLKQPGNEQYVAEP